MIKRRIPALLLALSPFWVSVSVNAEEANQIDPVAAIDEKINIKQNELDTIASDYEDEAGKLQQLKNEQARLTRDAKDLNAKRNRAKSALDKQYSRLLDDPETDLISFQKKYQETWAAVKKNQSDTLENDQAMTEVEMRLSQVKQKQARLNTEFSNLRELRVDARVKRIQSELRESDVLETSYKTTCSTTMTLGECANQGSHLTKQKAVKAFRSQLLDNLTESVIAKQNLKGVQLNIHIQESQVVRSGFEGNNEYFTQLQAQLQAKPEAVAACKLLNVSSRYCLTSDSTATTNKKDDKKWANVTVRSDQYNDSVVINGVNYGSTPVEVVLPNGRHQVSVSKNGFETYNRVITINGSDTVWVKLLPSKES
ncbi:PEGA domain-containing protein [Vibrio genomosp. F10]|uniref:Chromosome partitioning protein ParA n=2 Tax=Vibrio genomosp. F10 TaxID=723171 RepID=A0A1B9QUY7_9VIBR|nr:PEGA domain-containing protein [Vibrio genomosp. F10]OCH72133.1 chromosome partitioning protein ParA [Vibrio genomosp. F10]OEE32176.1 chromosome partitioning protein ParA [Vibrio genomosp. F10 str. ZF-129]OEE93719.1 chromosome partitioning protein ParA [Vibrio genomosp. F10 str. 9ZC157]OEF03311.1 chromosome partitioning protein ParA [Vibrio genomosp. F10 str. 9ZD137]OEF09739.1 chromosome partitioning protein ParA [Vibrio genomosp. F10 str. 9ZB36]